MEGISLSFGGVRALDRVDFDVYPGEVHGLLGHNGAGKSTLIRVLSGVYRPDEGRIWVRGEEGRLEEAVFHSPRDAQQRGIETIHQSLALADNLDAVANIFLGRERVRGLSLDEETMEAEARRTLERVGARVFSLRVPVISMSGGQRQAVAIARALQFRASVLIMDEPTAALGPEETARVKDLIRSLRSEGLGIVLISHDLHDVFDLSDRITVMKGGRVVGTVYTRDVTHDEVLQMIIAGVAPER
ncbi:ABC transporter ATP-binding protein [Thermus scotoductus]|uniref:ABC transporter ATP-binding protein n=2 Tax=Thermus scotoductus TaxID=37636 RepID=A0A430R6M6_THESC|nr:ABC transporter ATP-binding protein [Thermus scotoductus]RTH03082.1 ABC transporter ATP-binding protein [Thermus scotoductus]RTH17097.1 ABC transporter ATP-binding protein [Thermus scotoductus]RTH97639.1 ABC transporter ATP-binding protein [Thermus scotoductus]RTI17562.1 ABC transporter ATP-binding protein [Thermus scotoductus]